MEVDITSARLKLDYPLYCAQFVDERQLLVAGGGGESKSGLSNKISLIDTHRDEPLRALSEIELARDEDSVTSLALGPVSRILYAGVNSKSSQVRALRNEHFCIFQQPDSSGRSPTGKLLISRRSLFTPDAPRFEAFQRLTRALTRPLDDQIIVAVASGSAKSGELVLISHGKSDFVIRAEIRIDLGQGNEVTDLDLHWIAPDSALLLFTTKDQVFSFPIASSLTSTEFSLPTKEGGPRGGLRLVYTLPAAGAGQEPRIRGSRFLTQDTVGLLVNNGCQLGADLRILRLYDDDGDIVFRKRLGQGMGNAVGMDAVLLRDPEGLQHQAVFAIASQNTSIGLLALTLPDREQMPLSFTSPKLLSRIHSFPTTALSFCRWTAPARSSGVETGAQNLKLASVSADQTVVVHSIPLTATSRGTGRSRYVVDQRRSAWALRSPVLVLLFAVVLVWFIRAGMGLPEMEAIVQKVDPVQAQNSTLFAQLENGPDPSPSQNSGATLVAQTRLADLQNSSQDFVVVVHKSGELSVNVDTTIDTAVGQRWSELEEPEKARWREKLAKTGHWVAAEGEHLLERVLFSEVAAMIGQQVAGG